MYFMADYYDVIRSELTDFGEQEWLDLFLSACGSKKTDDRGYDYYEVSSEGWAAFMSYAEVLGGDFSDYASTIEFAQFTPYLSTHNVGGL